MATTDEPVLTPIPTTESYPPSENGDELTRNEFHQSYLLMPDVKKAELINGVVFMPSPVRVSHHGEPHALLMGWLMVYWTQSPWLKISDNSTVILDDENELQPDCLLRIDEQAGGQSQVKDDYVWGAPELIVEISGSTVSQDRNAKLDLYEKHGVAEYIIWRVKDREIDWFQLQEQKFQPLDSDAQGVIQSRKFPGLWLDTKATIKRDGKAVLETLHKGIASTGHSEFVQQLQRRATAK